MTPTASSLDDKGNLVSKAKPRESEEEMSRRYLLLLEKVLTHETLTAMGTRADEAAKVLLSIDPAFRTSTARDIRNTIAMFSRWRAQLGDFEQLRQVEKQFLKDLGNQVVTSCDPAAFTQLVAAAQSRNRAVTPKLPRRDTAFKPRPPGGKQVCRDFTSAAGCKRELCRFQHVQGGGNKKP
eukprot:CAMPEP_0118955728 /NCGR_PEP_ID=MMETSP1169-20130426/60420_1 /TAXON_ID=36882 /ORGANISM="Pyramimonas obovata, Strain CCMP722" /LENGTH=180 /DNA_ID=CAMNT_0006903629 /DNA_START=204 /DNA_END=745 /DNA_ORIENTATION=-